MDLVWPRKILRELTANKTRTALTVLSIAVGLFAVSLTFRTQAILSSNVLGFYAGTIPASIIVQVQPANAAVIETIRRVPGVYAAEAVQHISARAQVGATWQALALTGVSDPAAMQVNQLRPDGGAWPPPKRAMLLERSYLESAGQGVGGNLLVELDDGRRVRLPVAGAAHDVSVISGHLGNPVLQGYVSLDTAAWLTGSRAVNELLIAVGEGHRDIAQLQLVADRVRDKLGDAGYTVVSMRLRDASVPETYSVMTAVFRMLNVLGGLSLALSVFLVINTTSAMLARHVQQIGVMKAIGARPHNVFLTYFGLVLLIALMALLLALPLAALGAWQLATRLAWLLNYDIYDVGVPPGVLAVELLAGIIAPLLASTYPVGSAARITVREALSGLRAGASGSRAARDSAPVPGAPIALLYAARSMFRRKARLALTLAALVFGGAIEITVVNTQASLFATLDQVAAYWQQDLTVSFNQPQSAYRAAAEAAQVQGVGGVEQQPAALAVRQRPGGGESEDQYAIYGVLPQSALIKPTLVQGRWLAPGDHDAIVVNVDFLKHEPGLALGDRLRLTIDNRATDWQIVGVVTSHLLVYQSSSTGQGVGYVSSAAFAQKIYRSDQTNRIIITTTQHDAAFQDAVARDLEAHFAEVGIQALVQTRSDIRDQISRFVSLIVVLLLVMALSFVAIGALSLVGAMSLNVLERTKEIGVLRAIGGSHQHVAVMVVAEGICIGVVSWVPATLLALPMSRLLSDVLGWSILSWPLIFVVPPSAPLLWLGIVVVLAACASYAPAHRAAHINVRSALEHQ